MRRPLPLSFLFIPAFALATATPPAPATTTSTNPTPESLEAVTDVDSADADAVFWPVAWSTPRTLEYDVVLANTRVRNGVTVVSTAREMTRIASAKAPAAGQVWTSHQQTMEFGAGYPPDQQAIVEALQQALEGVPLQVTLDAHGSTSGLANLADIAPKIRDVVDTSLQALDEKALARMDPARQPEARARLAAHRQAVMTQIGNESTLRAMLLRTPASLNFPGRGGITPGEVLTFDAPTPNAIGGTPFPTTATLQLAAAPVTPGIDELRYETRLDPKESLPLLLQTVEKMVGQQLPPEMATTLADRVDVRTVTTWRIERATGIVRWMQRDETRSILGADDRNLLTMTLRD